MQPRDASTNGRSRSSTMAEVSTSSAGRGTSGTLAKASETAHSNENNGLHYKSTSDSPIDNLQGEGTHPDQMLIPFCQGRYFTIWERLQTAATLPPVTKSSLSELDLNWIMHNISLRIDVNYDHDLHFMPIQGPTGYQKKQDAKKYWLALATEFRIYEHNLTYCPDCQQVWTQSPMGFRSRLPKLLETLRELLETLVPDRDHAAIAERLDIPLLMQQIKKGVLDIVRLSQWIAELLKSHCAPMRDEWADEMTSKIEEGSTKSDVELVVEGLEKLFNFLEAMKLVRHILRKVLSHTDCMTGRCKSPNSNLSSAVN